MAALCTRVKVTFRDRYGQQAGVTFHVAPGVVDPSSIGVQAIIAAIEAACRAKAVKIELTQIYAPVSSATAGVPYVMVDKALFKALDQDGQAHNWKIPGPGTGIFLSDGETVDLTDADVSTWISAVTTHAKGPGGATVANVLSGHRTTNRKPLKV